MGKLHNATMHQLEHWKHITMIGMGGKSWGRISYTIYIRPPRLITKHWDFRSKLLSDSGSQERIEGKLTNTHLLTGLDMCICASTLNSISYLKQ